MIKEIITDRRRLSIPSIGFTVEELNSDLPLLLAADLFDTANHHKANCAGLAANQIGQLHRMFVMQTAQGKFRIAINPKIIAMFGGIKSRPENCLSLPGIEPVMQRRHLKVIFTGYTIVNAVLQPFQSQVKRLAARVVQHEMDHLNGKYI